MVFNVVVSILSFAAIIISGISLAEKRRPGPQGEQGPQGIQGKQGPRGLKGDKGDNLTINEINIKDIPFILVDEEKEELVVNGSIKTYKVDIMPTLELGPVDPMDDVKPLN